MGERGVSVGGAVGYALSLLAAHWRAVWGVLALNALAATVLYAGQFSRNGSLMLAGAAGGLIAGLMLQGALFRLAFADGHPRDPEFSPGQLGLQWRRLETRMLLAGLLAVIALLLVAFLLALAIVAVLFGVLTSQGIDAAAALRMPADPADLDPARHWPLLMAQAALAVPLVYLALRLSLIMPATLDRKSLQVFRTWKWTRGQVLRILAAGLLLQLPFLFLSTLALAPMGPAGSESGGPAGALGAALLLGVPAGAVLTPLMAGMTAYFYRQLAPAEGAA